MILQRLIEYYDRLKDDPKDPVPEFGFSRESISFAIVIDPTGGKPELQDIRVLDDRKKPRPRKVEVPDRGGRSGTKLFPFFLWDNTGYVLGRDSKGRAKRCHEMFEAYCELHRKMAEQVDDEGLAAVVKFLGRWTPDRADSLALWDEAIDTNIVFQIRGQRRFVHENKSIRKAWLKFLDSEQEKIQGVNLIDGQAANIARLHPLISGVVNAQAMGAALASFNAEAYESHGWTQTFNAPVSINDAFRYTTALNRLLEGGKRKIVIGDATMVYWASAPVPEEDQLACLLAEEFVDKSERGSAEDTARVNEIQNFIRQLKMGHRSGEALDESDKSARFYVLGLSPNASRLSVRYWWDGTVSEMRQRLGQHLLDLELVGQRDNDLPLTIKLIVNSTGRATNEWGSYDTDSVSPLLAGAIARAVLTGGPYPPLLLSALTNRLRADGMVRYERIAAIKACLNRNSRLRGEPKEVPVSLDADRNDIPYVTGRLFALLERIQESALGGNLNATIKDRYFSSASATPALVFPRLIRLSQHHLAKLEPGHKIHFDRLYGEIMGKLDGFARHMPLEDQGLFSVGYYHQRQNFFTKKDKEGETP